jgi:N-acetylglucosamine-6-sulfatase
MAMQAVQELAKGGAEFDNFYATDPLCCPSRATALTGMYSHNHGILKNSLGRRSGWATFRSLGHTESYLPLWLNESGYATGIFGKLMNGYTHKQPVPPGFDVAKITSNSGEDAEAASEAQTFFAENVEEGPVAVFLWLHSPHNPFRSPAMYDGDFDAVPFEPSPAFNEQDVSEKPGFIRKAQRFRGKEIKALENQWRTRLEMTRRVEAGLIAMQQTANALNEENTVYVVTSDNGWFLGEHRISGGKTLPYDPAAHMPLVISGPGVEPGVRHEVLVGNHDLAPTLAELAGVQVPPEHVFDGRSLVPLLEGQDVRWRDALLIEHRQPVVKLEGKHRPLKSGYHAMRTAGGLYIEWERSRYTEYYEDEWQTEPSPPPEDASSRLAALSVCSGDSCRSAEGP